MIWIESVLAVKPKQLLDFFDRPEQGFCYCQYWHMRGDQESWLACDSAQNRDICTRQLENRQLHGMVAVEDDKVLGWLRMAPTLQIPKLYDQRLAPLHPDGKEWSVLCLSVAEERRGQGLGKSLVGAAVNWLRFHKVPAVKAYPRVPVAALTPSPDGELPEGPGPREAVGEWTGPLSLYVRMGFRLVRRGPLRWTVARNLRSLTTPPS